jgi:hypothetical protein
MLRPFITTLVPTIDASGLSLHKEVPRGLFCALVAPDQLGSTDRLAARWGPFLLVLVTAKCLFSVERWKYGLRERLPRFDTLRGAEVRAGSFQGRMDDS